MVVLVGETEHTDPENGGDRRGDDDFARAEAVGEKAEDGGEEEHEEDLEGGDPGDAARGGRGEEGGFVVELEDAAAVEVLAMWLIDCRVLKRGFWGTACGGESGYSRVEEAEGAKLAEEGAEDAEPGFEAAVGGLGVDDGSFVAAGGGGLGWEGGHGGGGGEVVVGAELGRGRGGLLLGIVGHCDVVYSS